MDLLLSVEDEEVLPSAGELLPAIPEAGSQGSLEQELELLPAGEGQTQERPMKDAGGSTEQLSGLDVTERAESPPASRAIPSPPLPDMRSGFTGVSGHRSGRGGSQDALSSLDNSASSTSSFLHGLDTHPLGSLPAVTQEDEIEEGEEGGEENEGRRASRLSRRSVSWADEACVVEDDQRGSPSVHRLPLEVSIIDFYDVCLPRLCPHI